MHEDIAAGAPSHAPKPPPDPKTLRHPLVFFLTSDERTRVLRALRARGVDRRAALLRTLKLKPTRHH